MTTSERPELERRLREAFPGLSDNDFGYYATDLYVKAVPGIIEWLRENYRFFGNITLFIPQDGGKSLSPDLRALGITEVWLDVPFAGRWR